MTAKTIIERIDEGLKSDSKTIPATAHAAIAAGKVVQISTADGATSAPADNDRLGLFGVALHDVASGAEGVFIIRGYADIMTGDTTAVGHYMNPMADMMVNDVGTQTDGNGFCKLLETGEDGVVKQCLISGQ